MMLIREPFKELGICRNSEKQGEFISLEHWFMFHRAMKLISFSSGQKWTSDSQCQALVGKQ